MSIAFIKLQVFPIELANLITIIELPTLTSGFSHRALCFLLHSSSSKSGMNLCFFAVIGKMCAQKTFTKICVMKVRSQIREQLRSEAFSGSLSHTNDSPTTASILPYNTLKKKLVILTTEWLPWLQTNWRDSGYGFGTSNQLHKATQ